MKKITRVWHGTTKAEHADKYLKFVEATGMKEYRLIAGNLSAKLLRRIDGDICHFLTVTEWDSYASIKKFAGEKYELAKYYPGDEKFLLTFEEFVAHYETFEY
ncbi:MAG TPA: antibiotic biosynthesis monooxygenase [Chryseolinea sp.]|jgi:heme-degrading monooxygenase HmoA|nr:antibiotic biosynthesis monooxygenase [Chryseolinea sp.]